MYNIPLCVQVSMYFMYNIPLCIQIFMYFYVNVPVGGGKRVCRNYRQPQQRPGST